MLHAAGLSPDDARMILARRTAEALEGGRVARLAPANRERLERLATRLGVRPFDANLVIAITQDAARHGEEVDAGRLALVRAPAAPREHDVLWAVLSAVLLAGVLFASLVHWISGR